MGGERFCPPICTTSPKNFCDYAPETHALLFLTHIILAIVDVKDKACHKAHNAISTSPTINFFCGLGNTLVPSIGTQINIENLNIDMSSKTLLDHENGGQCLVIDQREIKTEQDLVLGKVLYHKYYINYAHNMSFFCFRLFWLKKVHF